MNAPALHHPPVMSAGETIACVLACVLITALLMGIAAHWMLKNDKTKTPRA